MELETEYNVPNILHTGGMRVGKFNIGWLMAININLAPTEKMRKYYQNYNQQQKQNLIITTYENRN